METSSLLLTLGQETFSHYGPIGVLIVMAILFGVGNLLATQVVGRLLKTRRQGPVKGTIYESGMNPIGDARRRFNVRFYVVAMTFLVFDVEIVFLYPWAVTFPSLANDDSGLPLLFLGRMLFFILTSMIAFAYAWRKGVFRYD